MSSGKNAKELWLLSGRFLACCCSSPDYVLKPMILLVGSAWAFGQSNQIGCTRYIGCWIFSCRRLWNKANLSLSTPRTRSSAISVIDTRSKYAASYYKWIKCSVLEIMNTHSSSEEKRSSMFLTNIMWECTRNKEIIFQVME